VTLPVDGNVLAGALREAFGSEMTTAVGTCGHCGASAELVEMVVYLSAAGAVGRCRRCENVLLVAIVRRGETLLDTRGLASLEGS
jgi:Family of unknown function (DUF6510)